MLGSADGYNTESPERLHIDLAKEAYRASNKRDYVEQMALWLQRHEALWLQESYLIWVDKRLLSLIRNEDNAMEEEELKDVIEHVDVTQRDINITYSQDDNFNNRLKYSLAKRPPHQNITVEKLTQKFGTVNFLSALTSFLRHYLPATKISPTNCDRFDAYKQLVIRLPRNHYLSEKIHMDRVRTTPPLLAGGRALATAAHFDTAFVVEDLRLYKSEGGISGIFLTYSDLLIMLIFFSTM